VVVKLNPGQLFFGVRVRQPFYFGSTRTPGHLILGVLTKFSGVYYSRTPVNGSPDCGQTSWWM